MLRTRAETREPRPQRVAGDPATHRNAPLSDDPPLPRLDPAPAELPTDGFLKLMLILLAFFVVLYSRSEISATKAGPVLEALADRFAAPPGSGAESEPLDGSTLAEERLRRRLAASLPVQARARRIAGMLIAFDLAAADLFDGAGPAIRRERLVLLNRLATALAERGTAWDTPLLVTTLLPESDAGAARDRLVALAGVLEANGLDGEKLGLGFAALPVGIWRFTVPRAAVGEVHAD